MRLDCCDYLIVPGIPERVDELVEVWELSVRATHDFLNEEDIQALKPLVEKGVQSIGKLFCMVDKDSRVRAFMGVEGDKLEMLFVHPQDRGKGLGKKLVDYGVKKAGIRYVDVNEQNPQAIGFYEYVGFCFVGRSERDGQGDAFPILHLKLEK